MRVASVEAKIRKARLRWFDYVMRRSTNTQCRGVRGWLGLVSRKVEIDRRNIGGSWLDMTWSRSNL